MHSGTSYLFFELFVHARIGNHVTTFISGHETRSPPNINPFTPLAPHQLPPQNQKMRVASVMSTATLVVSVLANRVPIDENANRLVCEGMYAKKDWGGSIQPHIEVTITRLGDQIYDPKKSQEESNPDSANPSVRVSYALFEYNDVDYLGKEYTKSGRKKYICDDVAISAGLCDLLELGMILHTGDLHNTSIRIGQFDHLGAANLSYPIGASGYYCLTTYLPNAGGVYRGEIDFQNAFGQLSASEIPMLPAYGILTIAYAATLGFFGFQFFKKRDQNQILPIQRYLAAMLGLLTFETLVIWSYYDLVNRTVGKSWFVKAYAVFLSILSSLKITLCLFLLMLVSRGYGIVVLKLPKKIMRRCKIFAAIHFTATMVYLLGNYLTASGSSFSSSNDVDESGSGAVWVQIFIFVPVTITLCLYYVFILLSMRETSAKLHKQRQVIKLKLLENLFNIVLMSWMLSFTALFFPIFFFFSYSDKDGIESKWKFWFFIQDFWPSLAFFIIFLGVSWLWRPTETSYMLAVSQQLSSTGGEGEGAEGGDFHNQQEFELDDISLMSHSDEEAGGTRGDSFELDEHTAPPTAPPTYKEVAGADTQHQLASNTLFELDDEEGTGFKPGELDTRLK